MVNRCWPTKIWRFEICGSKSLFQNFLHIALKSILDKRVISRICVENQLWYPPKTLANHIRQYIWLLAHTTHSKLRFHKFTSENVLKICGFFKGLHIIQSGDYTFKVHFNASNFAFLNIRTHSCKNLYAFQELKSNENHTFGGFQAYTSWLI